MLIPDLRVTAIKCEGIDAWAVVIVEFEWLNGVYCRDALSLSNSRRVGSLAAAVLLSPESTQCRRAMLTLVFLAI